MKKLLLVFIVLLTFSFPAYADLNYEDTQKTYPVSFGDWVYVYLISEYKMDTDYYFVGVTRRMINGKVRYIIRGGASSTPFGKDWYENIGSKIAEAVEVDCDIWTSKGYPISLNDFEIDIKAPQGQ